MRNFHPWPQRGFAVIPAAKIPYPKKPLRLDEQVRQLQSRGLVIPDAALAEQWLGQLNYYRLAGYALPFEQHHASHTFIPGTRFDDVLNLYLFDRKLRLLVIDAIERFEVALRTQFAYHLSHSYQSAHPHLKPELFHRQDLYSESKETLSHEIRRSSEDLIRHLTQKYQEELPPVWAVVELITMGQLSKWYRNLKERSDRQSIARLFALDERILVSFCQHVSVLRNYCAHHGRIWNRDFVFTFKLPTHCDTELKSSLWYLPDEDRRLRKVYNTLTMLAYFMRLLGDQGAWAQKLAGLIPQYGIDVSKMGFPENWRERPLWEIPQKAHL